MDSEKWRKVKSVLERAMELPLAARVEYLDRACADDELRREVEELLKYENAEEDLLESSVFASVSAASENALVGAQIGKYRILKELGAGGMGAVYLAERNDGAFEQRVALKLIKRGMDTDAILRRFVNERQILASLKHPNIAHLIDGGTTESGLPYFVMEYVEGRPLDEYCDEQRLSVSERLELFRAVCSAVAYAHRHLVIHRDLKPSNILVTKDAMPKLLDFGIAKILRSETTQTTEVTETIFRAMTPRYASPEQIRGGRVTAATDVYSLGVLLYELLTGRSPYNLKNLYSAELAKVVGEAEPERPSAAVTRGEEVAPTAGGANGAPPTREYLSRTRGNELEKLRRRLRGDLDDIVLTALCKEPEERYVSVEEFSEDIERHLKGLPPRSARRMTLVRRSAALLKRKAFGNLQPSLALLVLLVLLTAGVVSGLSIYLLQNRSEHAAALPNYKSIAVLPFKYAGASESEDNPLLGAGLADYLITRLGENRKLEVRPMSAVKTYTGGDVSPRPIGQNLGVDAVLNGSIRRKGENVSIAAELVGVGDGNVAWQRTYSGGRQEITSLQNALFEDLARSLALTLTETDRRPLTSLRTKSAKAYELYVRGRYFWNMRTKGDYEKAIEYFNQALAQDPDYADAYAGLADAYALLACVVPFDRRPEKMQSAKEYARRAISLDETMANPHATLGFIGWHYDWDWEASDREFKRAIELNPSYATAHQWYALLLVRVARFDEAVAEIRRAIALDPFSFAMHQDHTEILFISRRYDETIEAARKGAELAPVSLIDYPFSDQAYYYKGDYQAYISLLERRAERSGRSVAALKELANAYLRLDRESDWRKISDELRSRGDSAEFTRYRNFSERKKALEALEKKRAFEWLEYEYKNRGAGITAIHVRPEWDKLRESLIAQEYIRRMGLSQYAVKSDSPAEPAGESIE